MFLSHMGSKVISLQEERAGASKSLQKMEQTGSCKCGEYGNSSGLLALLGLGHPATEDRELNINLCWCVSELCC